MREVSFVAHVTRGLIRDQTTRRKTMFIILVLALLLLFLGSTLLQSILNPREHPGWFMLYWVVCAWLTLTAMLLAIFDMLAIRAQTRKAQRILRGELSDERDSPRSTMRD